MILIPDCAPVRLNWPNTQGSGDSAFNISLSLCLSLEPHFRILCAVSIMKTLCSAKFPFISNIADKRDCDIYQEGVLFNTDIESKENSEIVHYCVEMWGWRTPQFLMLTFPNPFVDWPNMTLSWVQRKLSSSGQAVQNSWVLPLYTPRFSLHF